MYTSSPKNVYWIHTEWQRRPTEKRKSYYICIKEIYKNKSTIQWEKPQLSHIVLYQAIQLTIKKRQNVLWTFRIKKPLYSRQNTSKKLWVPPINWRGTPFIENQIQRNWVYYLAMDMAGCLFESHTNTYSYAFVYIHKKWANNKFNKLTCISCTGELLSLLFFRLYIVPAVLIQFIALCV